jgi:hypothetical protein
MYHYEENIVDSNGTALNGWSIELYAANGDPSTAAAIAIYSDRSGTTAIAGSRVRSVTQGYVSFYVPLGKYGRRYFDASGALKKWFSDSDMVGVDDVALSLKPSVFTPAAYQTANLSTNVAFSGGRYSVWNGTSYVLVTGPTTPQTMTFATDSRAVTINSSGVFAVVTTTAATDTVVAWIKNGQLAEVVGANGASAYNADGGERPSVPAWPACIARLPFDPKITCSVSPTGVTTWACTFDVTTYRPTGGVGGYVAYFVNSGGAVGSWGAGSDSNAGTTRALPLKSIGAALGKGSTLIITVEGTGGKTYDRSNGWTTSTLNQDVAIISENGTAVFNCIDAFTTWTGIGSGVYTATRSLFNTIIDTTQTSATFGSRPVDVYKVSAAEVTAAGSASAAVQAAVTASGKGAFYVDGSNLVTAKAFDGRNITADATWKVMLDLPNGKVRRTTVGTSNIYLENLTFTHGRGTEVITEIAGGYVNFYCKDVNFQGSWSNSTGTPAPNALNIQGAVTSAIVGGTHKWGIADNLNYHYNTVSSVSVGVPIAFEKDVVSQYAGANNNVFNNASTIHDGGFILRYNGDYSYSTGPIVHDVNSGTEAVCIKCAAHDSINVSGGYTSDNSGFGSAQTGSGSTTQFLLDCTMTNTAGATNFNSGTSRQIIWKTPLGTRNQYYTASPQEFLR